MSRPLDRLTLLATFARIAERGSISAAARDLGLSQASASRQLKELEDRLSTDLIRRTTHALSLTAAGAALLSDARSLLSDWEALEERHGSADRALAGPLKVVAPIALGQGQLADIAFRFQRAHPQVSMLWQLQDDAIRFAEVGCDCWIKVGPVPDDTLIVKPLGRVERLVVAAPDLVGSANVREPDDLTRLPCAALDPFEGGRIRLGDRNGTATTIAPPVHLSTNNIVAQRRAALLGVGFAVMPHWFVADDLAAGRLVDPLPEWRAEVLSINAAFLPARHQPRRLLAFLDAVVRDIASIPGIEAANASVE